MDCHETEELPNGWAVTWLPTYSAQPTARLIQHHRRHTTHFLLPVAHCANTNVEMRIQQVWCALLLVPCCVGAMAAPTSSTRNVDMINLGAHVGAVVAATAEIVEDVESIGHGHGMLLLCGSRLCRELNVLREAAAGEIEDIEKTRLYKMTRAPLRFALRLLSSTLVTVTLALAGLGAAFLEVMEDSSPGGHHGAVFLAVNELLELLEASRVAQGRLLRVIENQVLRLFLVVSATLFAAIETFQSVGKVGAHHGVLLLSVSKTFRCIGLLRGRLKEKEE